MYLIALFCLLAAIGTEGFAQRGKTSPRRPAEAISQTSTQEEDADSSDVKGGISPADESGSLGNPSEEAGKLFFIDFGKCAFCAFFP